MSSCFRIAEVPSTPSSWAAVWRSAMDISFISVMLLPPMSGGSSSTSGMFTGGRPSRLNFLRGLYGRFFFCLS